MVQVHGGTQLVVKQWGYKPATATWTKITFPIAYSSDCYSVVTMNYGHYGSSGSPSKDKSTTGFYTLQDYPITWIATGKQQWGRNGASFRGTIVYNFPIAFTTEMMWVSNSHNTSSTNDSPWACGGWGGTLTSVSVYSNGTDVSYIAIGR